MLHPSLYICRILIKLNSFHQPYRVLLGKMATFLFRNILKNLVQLLSIRQNFTSQFLGLFITLLRIFTVLFSTNNDNSNYKFLFFSKRHCFNLFNINRNFNDLLVLLIYIKISYSG